MRTKKQNFHERLRDLRVNAGKSMGEVARALAITTVYYSEVENGKKNAFPPHKVDYRILAQTVNGDQGELERLAIEERERHGIALKPKTSSTQEMAILLARCINENLLDAQGIAEINKVLKRSQKRGTSK